MRWRNMNKRMYIQEGSGVNSCFSLLLSADELKQMWEIDYFMSEDPKTFIDMFAEFGGYSMLGSVQKRLAERKFNTSISRMKFDPSFRLFEGIDFASWSHQSESKPFFTSKQHIDMEFLYLMLKCAVGVDEDFKQDLKKVINGSEYPTHSALITILSRAMIDYRVPDEFFKDRVFFFEDLPYAKQCLYSLALKGAHVYFKGVALPAEVSVRFFQGYPSRNTSERIVYQLLEEL